MGTLPSGGPFFRQNPIYRRIRDRTSLSAWAVSILTFRLVSHLHFLFYFFFYFYSLLFFAISLNLFIPSRHNCGGYRGVPPSAHAQSASLVAQADPNH